MRLFISLAVVVPTVLATVLSSRQIGSPSQLATIITNCTEPDMAALTFDDGPAQFESRLVDVLDSLNVTATFFINGNNSAFECIFDESATESVKKAFASGHQISSHTWQHLDLTTLTAEEIDTQMNLTETALQKILGIVPAFMRPPFGSVNDLVRQVAASRNQPLILWSFDTGDWNGNSFQTIQGEYDAAIALEPKQSVLPLGHEWVNLTVEQVVPFAVPALRNAGYRLVSVAECVGAETAYQSVGEPSERDATWVC